MERSFFKYQGTGNDFVIIDNRAGEFGALSEQQIAFLCHRRFGIGADGLMLLQTKEGFDFEMKYYNADGRQSTMCGNGGRCLVQAAADLGIKKDEYLFSAVDGPHAAVIRSNETVALKMNNVKNIQKRGSDFILDTGSPHFVRLCNDVEQLDVFATGREIRYSSPFASEGINVNFVEGLDKENKILVRTYERGVEDETYSCGTGVTAAAVVSAYNQKGFNQVFVQTKGGALSVEFESTENGFENIWLIGPAKKVFSGTVAVPLF